MTKATRGGIVWPALFKLVVKILSFTKSNIAQRSQRALLMGCPFPAAERPHTRKPSHCPSRCSWLCWVQTPHPQPQLPGSQNFIWKSQGETNPIRPWSENIQFVARCRGAPYNPALPAEG